MIGIEWMKPGVIVGSIMYALIGVAIFWICFVIVDKLTPYHLWDEIVEKKNIALAYVPPKFAEVGTSINIEIRGQGVKAKVVPTPFYKKPKKTGT